MAPITLPCLVGALPSGACVSRTELVIQLLKIAIAIAFGAYFLGWSWPSLKGCPRICAGRLRCAFASWLGSASGERRTDLLRPSTSAYRPIYFTLQYMVFDAARWGSLGEWIGKP